MKKKKPAILLLEDGRSFEGAAFGHIGETTGEVCFNTGMSGYQEILTDPSYCQQIVTMTAPHIGNYGVNSDDIESNRIQVAGFVVKEETEIPSNWRSAAAIGSYLDDQKYFHLLVLGMLVLHLLHYLSIHVLQFQLLLLLGLH